MKVVANAPLIAIDLIVENSRGEVLLGLRRNEPAAGFWFVPGGRVFKNENLEQAFRRISCSELGCEFSRQQAEWLGIYEHFYTANAGQLHGVDTHYVVLAHRLRLTEATELPLPLDLQHDRYCWLHPSAFMSNEDVHPYIRAYFLKKETV